MKRAGEGLCQAIGHIKKTNDVTPYLSMSMNVSIRVGNRQDDPVDVTHQVFFRDVNHQFVDGVKSGWQCDPFTSVEKRLHEDHGFTGVLE